MKLFIPDHRAWSMNRFWGGKTHWSDRSDYKNEVLMLVRVALDEAGGWDIHPPVNIHITAEFKSKATDSDNVMPKAYIDALQHWGVIPDDTPEYVHWVSLRSMKTGRNCVTIEIEESEA